jgi:hypothetical protein
MSNKIKKKRNNNHLPDAGPAALLASLARRL